MQGCGVFNFVLFGVFLLVVFLGGGGVVANPLAIVTAIVLGWLILNYTVGTLIREMQSSLNKPFNSKPSLIKIIYR